MDSEILDELFLKERHLYVKLTEFENISIQLGEAVDRRDEVSVQMLLYMREEPASQLQEIDQYLRARLFELPEEDAIRGRELLEGAPPQDPEEARLCAQVSQNQRLLQRCMELDRRISTRVDGSRSFYTKYR